jgi:hypothetical protein
MLLAISSQLGLVQIFAASLERGHLDTAGDLISAWSSADFAASMERGHLDTAGNLISAWSSADFCS